MFAGFQPDILEWLPAVDILVLPSLTEGTPMAVLEAMSIGVPIVASAVGGLPDFIETGVNGLLVNPGDVSALAGSMVTLKSDTALRERIAAEALKTIKDRFGIHDWCRKIEGQYDSLAQGLSRVSA